MKTIQKQDQIKLQFKQTLKVISKSSYHSQQYQQNMRYFKTHKLYSKQFINFIAQTIKKDSILTLKLLSQFFKQVNNTIKKYIQKFQRQSKFRLNLGLLYIAVTHKLSILKQYYGYQHIRQFLENYFQDSFYFIRLYQQWFQKCDLKVQLLNQSTYYQEVQSNYLTQLDKLIKYYIQAKLQKRTKIFCIYMEENLQIFDFVAKHNPFQSQYQFKQFIQNVLLMHKSYSNFNIIQEKTQKIIFGDIDPGMTQCVTCAQFFYIDFDLKGTKNNLCDIVPVERIEQLKSSLRKNNLKIQILALINSDNPSVILFGCQVQGLNVIIKGEYITQYQKDIWEQKFIDLTKSIKPVITINEDYRIQFVPIKQNPFKYQNSKFLKSVYVMRVKFHPKRPWILHCCQIDQVSYFYIRRKNQNIQLKGQQFYIQLRRRYMKYCPTYPINRQLEKAQKQNNIEKTIEILSLISGKRYVPVCIHQDNGPCRKPAIGQVGFTEQQEKEHLFYPQKIDKNVN